jgi:hypothetical protein
MQKTYKFDVICDDRFYIDNNTECGELVHLADFVSQDRGNWLKLDISALKKAKQHEKDIEEFHAHKNDRIADVEPDDDVE